MIIMKRQNEQVWTCLRVNLQLLRREGEKRRAEAQRKAAEEEEREKRKGKGWGRGEDELIPCIASIGWLIEIWYGEGIGKVWWSVRREMVSEFQRGEEERRNGKRRGWGGEGKRRERKGLRWRRKEVWGVFGDIIVDSNMVFFNP